MIRSLSRLPRATLDPFVRYLASPRCIRILDASLHRKSVTVERVDDRAELFRAYLATAATKARRERKAAAAVREEQGEDGGAGEEVPSVGARRGREDTGETVEGGGDRRRLAPSENPEPEGGLNTSRNGEG
jgi:hypothetical protein